MLILLLTNPVEKASTNLGLKVKFRGTCLWVAAIEKPTRPTNTNKDMPFIFVLSAK